MILRTLERPIAPAGRSVVRTVSFGAVIATLGLWPAGDLAFGIRTRTRCGRDRSKTLTDNTLRRWTCTHGISMLAVYSSRSSKRFWTRLIHSPLAVPQKLEDLADIAVVHLFSDLALP